MNARIVYGTAWYVLEFFFEEVIEWFTGRKNGRLP